MSTSTVRRTTHIFEESAPAGAETVSCLGPTLLADSDHPRVAALAARLAEGAASGGEIAARLARYVAEEVAYGVAPSGDETAASRTLALGYGHESAKATLLVALARAAGIPARVRVVRVGKESFSELLPGLLYALAPSRVPVAWAELFIEGRWVAFAEAGHDGEYRRAATRYLAEHGRTSGAGLVIPEGLSGAAAVRWVLERFPKASDEGAYRDLVEWRWRHGESALEHPLLEWFLGPRGREDFARRVARVRRRAGAAGRPLAAVA